jgi:hypothetical protein
MIKGKPSICERVEGFLITKHKTQNTKKMTNKQIDTEINKRLDGFMGDIGPLIKAKRERGMI